MKNKLIKALLLSGILLSAVSCKGGDTDPSSSEDSSGNPSTPSYIDPEDEPELPIGADITVYLVLSKIGLYENNPGTKIEKYSIENAIAYNTKVGDPLPGADKVTSTSGATFVSWVKYDGNGAPTKYETAPNKNNQILYVNWSSGSGGGGGGGGDHKPTSGMAIVINGENYYSLYNEGAWSTDPSFTQYSYTAGLALAQNDIISFYNADKDESWSTMAIDTHSHGQLTQVSSGIKVGAAGTYDVYIKMKMNNDNIYLGPHS